jgi:hypothetical protein
MSDHMDHEKGETKEMGKLHEQESETFLAACGSRAGGRGIQIRIPPMFTFWDVLCPESWVLWRVYPSPKKPNRI